MSYGKGIVASAIGALLLATSAQAEVAEVTTIGFTSKTNVHLKTTRTAAFEQLLKIGEWWNDDHTWYGKASNMSVEPKAGGCWCEVDGDKSSVHGTVSAITPGSLLRFDAALGPLQEMAVTGTLTFKLEDMGGQAHLYATYEVNGMTADEAKQLAPAVDGVIDEQIKRLAQKIAQAQ